MENFQVAKFHIQVHGIGVQLHEVSDCAERKLSKFLNNKYNLNGETIGCSCMEYLVAHITNH